jgi:hypothetical protein
VRESRGFDIAEKTHCPQQISHILQHSVKLAVSVLNMPPGARETSEQRTQHAGPARLCPSSASTDPKPSQLAISYPNTPL